VLVACDGERVASCSSESSLTAVGDRGRSS